VKNKLPFRDAASLEQAINRYGSIRATARALDIPVGSLTSFASRKHVRSENKGGRPKLERPVSFPTLGEILVGRVIHPQGDYIPYGHKGHQGGKR
jgi:hypothetical protein